ncbi:hypothetical protein C8Q79DRAFT_936839 [Trametes meyenii]|nr:hypothetical protein C8Q79DRAFT_936839 [Trametes meyenii]
MRKRERFQYHLATLHHTPPHSKYDHSWAWIYLLCYLFMCAIAQSVTASKGDPKVL